jgi:hypothetical protein
MNPTPAFWDSSALIPLCVSQPVTPSLRSLVNQYKVVVWWATPIEMQSAFQRLIRMGLLTPSQHRAAERGLDRLRRGWRELQPSEPLRSQAEILLKQHPLQAAEALQLAAAWIWSSGDPSSYVFISGDKQLLTAAEQVGFQAVAV